MFTIQPLFLHNAYDKISNEILLSLESDFIVINYFHSTPEDRELIKDILVSKVPYKIDKEVMLDTQGPFNTGILQLKFNTVDYLGKPLNEPYNLILTIDGNNYPTTSVEGAINIELECLFPTEIAIEVKDYLGQGFTTSVFNIGIEEVPEVVEPQGEGGTDTGGIV